MVVLTRKQELFCQAYAISYNIKQAAKEAGYAHFSQGWKQLRKPKIKDRLEELTSEQNERIRDRLDCSRERILQELMCVAFCKQSDVERAVDNLGELDEDVDPLVDAALSGITRTPTRNGLSVTVSRNNKLKALELIARINGFMTEEPSQSNPVTIHVGGKPGYDKDKDSLDD